MNMNSLLSVALQMTEGVMLPFKGLILLKSFTSSHSNSLLTSVDYYTLLKSKFFATVPPN
ncbi:hypothetical protein [Piscirickettsia salmonis]|nr:hypothetical protein [Piscirickettsia salmonis]QHS33271.1 hypothetical protein GW535_12995 [Piscirickettsia salmonis]